MSTELWCALLLISSTAAAFGWLRVWALIERIRELQAEVRKTKEELGEANKRADELQRELARAMEKLVEMQSPKDADSGLLQKVIEGLVALGVPGLVLLFVMATSGFFGAAAITHGLSILGGPGGMMVGLAVLVALYPTTKFLVSRYGLPKLARGVVRGLIAKGESPVSIRQKIDRIPKLVISDDLRRQIYETLANVA